MFVVYDDLATTDISDVLMVPAVPKEERAWRGSCIEGKSVRASTRERGLWRDFQILHVVKGSSYSCKLSYAFHWR